MAHLWPSDVWTDGEYGITFAIFDLECAEPGDNTGGSIASAVFAIRLDRSTLLSAHTLELRSGELEVTMKPIDTMECSPRDRT